MDLNPAVSRQPFLHQLAISLHLLAHCKRADLMQEVSWINRHPQPNPQRRHPPQQRRRQLPQIHRRHQIQIDRRVCLDVWSMVGEDQYCCLEGVLSPLGLNGHDPNSILKYQEVNQLPHQKSFIFGDEFYQNSPQCSAYTRRVRGW